MPDIKDSVGDGGFNRPHDVALVQVILRLVKDSKGQPYLRNPYDGIYGNQTKSAIIAFQKDHSLAAAPAFAPALIKGPSPTGMPAKIGAAAAAAAKAVAMGMAGVVKEKLGLMKAKAATMQKLNAMLPPGFKDIRIIEGTKTVYWPGSAVDAAAHQNKIAADPNLEPGFRAAVADLVRLMFDRHKIVLSVTPSGGRRTFQKQYELLTTTTSTQAGPGESNHNFGQAVDIGFKGWKWMRGSGLANVDDWWLNDLSKQAAAKAKEMWDARDNIAFKELGLFKSNLKGDLIHIQKFSDNNVSMRRSLADLLTRVGSMKWEHASGYQCDLGAGGKFFAVGTSEQIWNGVAKVSPGEIAAAKGVPVGQITPADVNSMRQQLKADFETAEKNWVKWQAKP